jgi:PAT family beta-lactamase induction signal transducer AmpG
MRDIGVDIRVVGLITLSQAPWTFKVLWAPLVDRYTPPFWGRRRGWMAVTQLALLCLGLALAGVGRRPEAIWVVGALALATAFASATQDIAIDAYAVEVLERDEQGAASGARTALYRAGMLTSGGFAITLAARIGWPVVNVLLACLFVPMLVVTWYSPEPIVAQQPPRSLKEALWEPFLTFLTRPRALEILAFVVLYKIGDQLAQALTRPFLIDLGYGPDARGVALGTISAVATIIGAVMGGWLTTLIGLGRSLWVFGFLQLFSNLGYYGLSLLSGPRNTAMYAAAAFELFTSGMGTGAFSVLLLRLTEKRFSATQYALFSSLFALPRVLAGPLTGFAVSAMGWSAFYLTTMVVGLPGLVMLHRFVPFGAREPLLDVATEPAGVNGRKLAARTLAASLPLAGAALLLVATLDALQTMRATPATGFAFAAALSRLVHPSGIGGWLSLAGIVAFALVGGMVVSARSASGSGDAA